jgi:hypothetical protein
MSPASFFFDSDIRPFSLSGPSLILVGAILLYIFYLSGSAIYNVYLHPLRGTPGPKVWIAFPFFYHLAAVRGLLDQNM